MEKGEDDQRWKRRLERERNARKEAEALLEKKSSELYQAKLELEARTAQQLQDKERRFETVFDSSMDGIVIHDLEGNIYETNREFKRQFGYADSQISSLKLPDLHPEKCHPACFEGMEKLKENGSHRFEAEFLRSDGSVFPAEISATIFRASHQQLVQGIVRDLTRRNKIYDQMKAAIEEAEEANRAKSQFLANMSHEIRTPMNGIIGVAELLEGTELTTEQIELTQTILTSGENLLDIINNILDFSKIESGKLELESEPFSLTDCVNKAMAGVVADASQKNVELACFIDPDLPDTYMGDGVRVRQVLTNLLGNATKFTDRGEVYLGIKNGASDSPGRQTIKITVRDTGIGIAKEDIPKLFQKFSQVDASTTRRFGGTGLGLVISERMIKQMGGKIEVESEVGAGTTFRIELSLPVGPDSNVPRACKVSLKGLKAVIVDDNETNRRIMTYQCRYLGMDAECYAEATSALERLNDCESYFDVALLDMQMPGMDGLGLAAEIKKISRYRKLPLVLVTSLGQGVKLAHAKDWPFQKYLYKPILLAPLETAIGEALNMVKQEAPEKVSEPLGKSLRVLIAEDNPINLKVAGKMVGKLGHEYDFALNGVEVLEKLAEGNRYDVILMDAQMPEMDGIAATREIITRYPDKSQRPAIIALTANALEGDRERFLASGMDDYLSKPLRNAELQSALSHL